MATKKRHVPKTEEVFLDIKNYEIYFSDFIPGIADINYITPETLMMKLEERGFVKDASGNFYHPKHWKNQEAGLKIALTDMAMRWFKNPIEV